MTPEPAQLPEHPQIPAHPLPAWLRQTAGEPRWQVSVAIAALIALQLALPSRYLPIGQVEMRLPVGHLAQASVLLPAAQVLLGVILFAANPRRIDHASPRLRMLSLLLVALASLANAFSAGSLVYEIVNGTPRLSALVLLGIGGDVWLTNILVFAIWYWEFDRGGPGARARAIRPHPDFVFPQMTSPQLAHHDWEPRFVDYLYVSYTNAAAFSPTDTLPFTAWPKLAMALQSLVSLGTAALVIARAVNILG
jgi:hypothetical protein